MFTWCLPGEASVLLEGITEGALRKPVVLGQHLAHYVIEYRCLGDAAGGEVCRSGPTLRSCRRSGGPPAGRVPANGRPV